MKVVLLSYVALRYGTPQLNYLLESLKKRYGPSVRCFIYQCSPVLKPTLRQASGDSWFLDYPRDEEIFFSQGHNWIDLIQPDILIISHFKYYRSYLKAQYKRAYLIDYFLEGLSEDETPTQQDIENYKDCIDKSDLMLVCEEGRYDELALNYSISRNPKLPKCLVYNSMPRDKGSCIDPQKRNGRIICQGGLHYQRNLINLILHRDPIAFPIELFGRGDKKDPNYYYLRDKKLLKKKNVCYKHHIPNIQLAPIRAQYAYLLVLWEPATGNYYYACPNKFFEAIASCVPPIVGPHPQCKAIIEKYKCGILMDDWSQKSFDRALEYAQQIYRTSEYDALVENCKKAFQNELCWENQFKKIDPYLPIIPLGKTNITQGYTQDHAHRKLILLSNPLNGKEKQQFPDYTSILSLAKEASQENLNLILLPHELLIQEVNPHDLIYLEMNAKTQFKSWLEYIKNQNAYHGVEWHIRILKKGLFHWIRKQVLNPKTLPQNACFYLHAENFWIRPSRHKDNDPDKSLKNERYVATAIKPLTFLINPKPKFILIEPLLNQTDMQRDRKPKFILIDPFLKNEAGHCYNYDMSVLRCAMQANFVPVIASHADCRVTIPKNFEHYPLFCTQFRSKKNPKNINDPHLFLETVLEILTQTRAQAGDHIFIPNISAEQLEVLAAFIAREKAFKNCIWHIFVRHLLRLRKANQSRFLLFLARYPSFRPLLPSRFKKGFQLSTIHALAQSQARDNVHFYTDTEALSLKYTDLFKFKFKVVPLPVYTELSKDALDIIYKDCDDKKCGNQQDQKRSFRVVYPGDARPEKGFLHLSKILHELHHASPHSESHPYSLEFVFHIFTTCYYTTIAEEIETLKGLKSHYKLQLVDTPLSPENYDRFLAQSDIVLLLYDAEAYQYRSSHMIMEALYHEKVPITLAGNPMCDILENDSAFICEHPNQVPHKIHEICENWEFFKEKVKALSQKVKAEQTPDRLFKMLIE